MRLLADFADELAALVRTGLASASQQALYAEVDALYRGLATSLQGSVAGAVRLTAETIAEAHAAAVIRLAPALEGVVRVHFTGVAPGAAQAVLARPDFARAFVSLRDGSAAEARQIIARGVLRGGRVDAIERQLRMHIGAPSSLVEGDAALLADRRRIGLRTAVDMGLEPTADSVRALRAEAGRVASKARLVGRQEVMNTEHETHVRTVEVNPVIRCVRVRLSGRHPVRDSCDAAAALDAYGFGPGRYPPERVPTRFHPRCLCAFTHELRPPAEWGMPRGRTPMRDVDWEAVAAENGLSPSEIRQLRDSVLVDSRGVIA